MFTGIIEGLGTLSRRQPVQRGARLHIQPIHPLQDLATGESIAVNGVCLTLEPESTPTTLIFFTSSETLGRTTLGELVEGAQLNIERALRADSRLGGHLVMGHVDAIGRLERFEQQGEEWTLEVRHPTELAPLIAPKGSIAVDGISLTVVEVHEDRFTVAVIPHTAQVTNLAALRPGTSVNLEADVLARYVARALAAHGGGAGGVTSELLNRAGFGPSAHT